MGLDVNAPCASVAAAESEYNDYAARMERQDRRDSDGSDKDRRDSERRKREWTGQCIALSNVSAARPGRGPACVGPCV